MRVVLFSYIIIADPSLLGRNRTPPTSGARVITPDNSRNIKKYHNILRYFYEMRGADSTVFASISKSSSLLVFGDKLLEIHKAAAIA